MCLEYKSFLKNLSDWDSEKSDGWGTMKQMWPLQCIITSPDTSQARSDMQLKVAMFNAAYLRFQILDTSVICVSSIYASSSFTTLGTWNIQQPWGAFKLGFRWVYASVHIQRTLEVHTTWSLCLCYYSMYPMDCLDSKHQHTNIQNWIDRSPGTSPHSGYRMRKLEIVRMQKLEIGNCKL